MDLVEFLRQRLDEDERAARCMDSAPSEVERNGIESTAGLWVLDYLDHFDAARVLRDVEARRRIVAMHHYDNDGYGPCCYVCADTDQTGSREGDWPCDTLKLLALPYADAPGYDEAWRP